MTDRAADMKLYWIFPKDLDRRLLKFDTADEIWSEKLGGKGFKCFKISSEMNPALSGHWSISMAIRGNGLQPESEHQRSQSVTMSCISSSRFPYFKNNPPVSGAWCEVPLCLCVCVPVFYISCVNKTKRYCIIGPRLKGSGCFNEGSAMKGRSRYSNWTSQEYVPSPFLLMNVYVHYESVLQVLRFHVRNRVVFFFVWQGGVTMPPQHVLHLLLVLLLFQRMYSIQRQIDAGGTAGIIPERNHWNDPSVNESFLSQLSFAWSSFAVFVHSQIVKGGVAVMFICRSVSSFFLTELKWIRQPLHVNHR